MPDTEQFPDNDRPARFLRESVDRFMGRLDIQERTSAVHEDRAHFEQWIRFCLVTSLLPDALAAACALFDFDAEVLNEKMPALLERALTPIPVDATFINDAMSRLPDHRRIKVVAENLHLGRGGWTWAQEVKHSFSTALCETLDIPDPPEEEGWDWWPPTRQVHPDGLQWP